MRRPRVKKRNECLSEILDEKTVKIVKDISRETKMPEKEVIKELVSDGLKYRELEKKYSLIDKREVWDNRFYYLKIEAGYLYYRLRIKELIDELKSLAMMSTGIAKELEMCYSLLESKENSIKERRENLKKLQEHLEKYIEEYVLPDEKELEEKRYADDKIVIESIKKVLKAYEKAISDEDKGKEEI
jgi:hypothetical protein